jgi:hypothetical protein
MQKLNSNSPDASQLALQAFIWALSDDARSERLMALTGLTPDAMRAGISEPSMQAAILAYLENHEPDLIACADALSVPPMAIVTARQELEA